MRALVELTRVELKLFAREPLTLVFVLVLPVVVLYVLNGVSSSEVPDPSVWEGLDAVDFYTSAYVALAAAFTSLGLLLGLLMPTARAAQGLGVLLFFVFMMLGGPGPPQEILPDALGLVGDAVPVTYAGRLLRDPWLGRGWDGGATLVMLGLLVATVALTAWVVRRQEQD